MSLATATGRASDRCGGQRDGDLDSKEATHVNHCPYVRLCRMYCRLRESHFGEIIKYMC